MKKSFLLLVFLSVSFLALDVSHVYSHHPIVKESASDSIYFKNPEYFIARKVLENKIVMLGDSPHDNYDSYNSLLKVLYALADQVKSESAVKTKVALILEIGPKDAKSLSDYITTGSPEGLINESLDWLYEDFEFYSNLRKFFEYINSVNYPGKIDIKIEGFESFNAAKDVEAIKRTPEQADSEFLLRDSILAVKVIKYISENSDSKALMFYGNGHLQKGLSIKKATFGTLPDAYSYFMADYLKRKFGNDKVITFNQKSGLLPEYFRGTALAEGEFSDIVAQFNKLDTARFADVSDFDYCVYWNKAYDNGLPHHFNLVLSRRNVESKIETFNYYLNYSDNEQVKAYNNVSLFYLNFITCGEFKGSAEPLKWDSLNEYNGLDVLNSERFKNKIYDVYAHSKTKKLLYVLGFLDKDIEIGDVSDTLNRFNEIWDANLKSIKFINEIGVMWVGYPDEQKKAKEYLTQYSGKEFDDPADYLDWYRKQQMNLY